MNLNTLYSIIALSAACFCSTLHAQDAASDQPDAVEQAPEARLFEFETSGFAFSVESVTEPVVREDSTGSVYSLTYQRRARRGGAYGTDGKMAFLRLTQTIDPLDRTVAVNALLDSTIREAVVAIDSAYGKSRDRQFSDCSLPILGEMRDGKRIDIGLLSDGSIAYVECYAFKDGHDNGVTVTLKLREPANNELPEDVLLAEELLIGLEVSDLQPDSQYFQTLAGYPLRLPVRSSVQSKRKVNQYVIEANVAYENGTMRVQLIDVPNGYNAFTTANDQVMGYAQTLNRQQQQGQLDLKWSAVSHIPAGTNGNGIVDGMTFSISTNGSDFYNSMYTVVDGKRIVAASFTGPEESASEIAQYAADFFRRPLSSVKLNGLPSYFGGHTLELPRGFALWGNPEAVMQNEFIVDSTDLNGWSQSIDSPIRHHNGHTRFRIYQSGEQVDLEMAHRAVCGNEYNRHRDEGNDLEQFGAESVVSSFMLDNGRVAESMTNTFLPLLSDAMKQQLNSDAHEITVTSYMLATDDGGARVVVSTVASRSTHADTDLLTRRFLEQLGAMGDADRISMPFGSLAFDSSEMYAMTRAAPASGDLQKQIQLNWGHDEMIVKTYRADERNSTLSSRLLAERYLRAEWDAATSADDRGLYPAESEGLGQVRVAGRSADMFEATVKESLGSVHLRVVGFLHDDSYSTVMIRLRGEQGVKRADRMIGLLNGTANEAE